MEKRDLDLIKKYSETDQVLANLYKRHLEYEEELDSLENKSYLTPEDQFKVRDIKKRKLMGRDQMESILRKYRASEKSA